MTDHELIERIGRDRGSDGPVIPMWAWWLASSIAAVGSMVSLVVARMYVYYSEENPSALKGRHVGDPPDPDLGWVLFGGVAVGLSVLLGAFANKTHSEWSQKGWSPAVKAWAAATVLAGLAMFFSAGLAIALFD